MYKKAGIVVGIVLIIAAIAIYLVVSAFMNKSDEQSAELSTSVTSPVQSTATNTTSSAPSQQVPIQTAPVVTPEPDTSVESSEPVAPSEPSGDAIILLDANKLPSYTDVSDVGTIVGHNVYSYNGQVIFALLINTTTNGQIEYFTSLKNFQLEDGSRVNCELRVYSSTSGIYPSVISLSVA